MADLYSNLASSQSAIGAGLSPYATPGVYNLSPANLLKWRKARSGVISGARRAKVACVGDSNTTGYGSVAGGAANCVAGSYPRRLSDRLTALGVVSRWDSAWGTILMIGINDWNAAISVATFTTNVQAVITKGQLTGDVILMAPIETSGAASAASQAAYRTAMRDLAVANGCVFIDMQERFGTYAVANANGFMADGSHPMGITYTDMACLVAKVLLAA